MPAPTWDGAAPRGGRPERFRPSPTAVLVAPVVVSAIVQVPAAIAIAVWTRLPASLEVLHVGLAIAGPLTLLAARRAPGPTVAAISALALADLLLPPDVGPPYVALAFAIVLAVARGALAWAVVSVVSGWVAAIVLASSFGPDWHPLRVAATTALLAACFGIGTFVRVRRERAAAYRADLARRRRTAEERERMRIARELHDVIGHALSQINVQASVGLHLMDRDPDQARSALESVKSTSKSALEEVRSVLGVIRGEGDAEGGEATPLAPQPDLAALPRLVAGVAAPGFEAELVDRLHHAPPRAVQLAVYRIAQEALTNVVRHADATRAIVAVERLDDELLLTVDDDGHGMRGATEGSGILGMRERAALLGGTVEVERSPGGGTRVAARLPWGAGA
ncbi:sensor histidine kinase [Agromyces kandeliae]|uniref:histidine kinase n=1 Tax=Agromyces kandeliae TaxID=2666141 RepID=A0A6L5QY91_9MICO|nr:sensor histidine kinase [Agromyces kandeliae]MRX42760.1 sensor histidine kinase [Agromyces kandeliae]